VPRPRLIALQTLATDGGERAFRAFVRGASDARLERTAGSDRGLRVLFAAMVHAYDPEQASGFTGELQYELRRGDGRVALWTVHADPRRATARPGPAADPALTLRTSVADFVRIAAGDLEAGRALIAGRLDLAGDFALAQRLGDMFGRPAAI
jgi:putative sterol carrier protein